MLKILRKQEKIKKELKKNKQYYTQNKKDRKLYLYTYKCLLILKDITLVLSSHKQTLQIYKNFVNVGEGRILSDE